MSNLSSKTIQRIVALLYAPPVYTTILLFWPIFFIRLKARTLLNFINHENGAILTASPLSPSLYSAMYPFFRLSLSRTLPPPSAFPRVLSLTSPPSPLFLPSFLLSLPPSSPSLFSPSTFGVLSMDRTYSIFA